MFHEAIFTVGALTLKSSFVSSSRVFTCVPCYDPMMMTLSLNYVSAGDTGVSHSMRAVLIRFEKVDKGLHPLAFTAPNSVCREANEHGLIWSMLLKCLSSVSQSSPGPVDQLGISDKLVSPAIFPASFASVASTAFQ